MIAQYKATQRVGEDPWHDEWHEEIRKSIVKELLENVTLNSSSPFTTVTLVKTTL